MRKSEAKKKECMQGETVLRKSICTGKTVLCLRDRQGNLREMCLIRSREELQKECSALGLPLPTETVY